MVPKYPICFTGEIVLHDAAEADPRDVREDLDDTKIHQKCEKKIEKSEHKKIFIKIKLTEEFRKSSKKIRWTKKFLFLQFVWIDHAKKLFIYRDCVS
jgi:hypothetical protein